MACSRRTRSCLRPDTARLRTRSMALSSTTVRPHRPVVLRTLPSTSTTTTDTTQGEERGGRQVSTGFAYVGTRRADMISLLCSACFCPRTVLVVAECQADVIRVVLLLPPCLGEEPLLEEVEGGRGEGAVAAQVDVGAKVLLTHQLKGVRGEGSGGRRGE